jgi:hypothetical protein
MRGRQRRSTEGGILAIGVREWPAQDKPCFDIGDGGGQTSAQSDSTEHIRTFLESPFPSLTLGHSKASGACSQSEGLHFGRGTKSLRCRFRRLLGRKRKSKSSENTNHFGIIAMVPSQVSTNRGHPVIGNFVRRSPNAWPPCAYKCISTGTPAFFRAM